MADSHNIQHLPKITFTFVEGYVAANSRASGDKSLSKGYKYWAEGYLKDLCGKYQTTLLPLILSVLILSP